MCTGKKRKPLACAAGGTEPTWRALPQQAPSTQPVVGLRFEAGLLSSGGAQQQLLVAQRSGLECWAIGAGGEARLLRTGNVAQARAPGFLSVRYPIFLQCRGACMHSSPTSGMTVENDSGDNSYL